MHHKRRRPRKQRGFPTGRWLVKPHKWNGVDDPPPAELRARLDEAEQREEGEHWNVCGSGIYPAGCPGCSGCHSCFEDQLD